MIVAKGDGRVEELHAIAIGDFVALAADSRDCDCTITGFEHKSVGPESFGHRHDIALATSSVQLNVGWGCDRGVNDFDACNQSTSITTLADDSDVI